MEDPKHFKKQVPNSNVEVSHLIKIGEDRARLRAKLDEYKERLNKKQKVKPYGAPETQLDFDTIYKIAITQKLVDDGEVNTHDLSRSLVAQYQTFNSELFNEACAVIQDYITTGGRNVIGGTGLPKVEEKDTTQ